MRVFIPLFTLAAVLAAEPLTQGERDRAMSHLHMTRKIFLDSLAGVTPAQWNFKPDPKVWSIAEVAEHIAVSEDTLFGMVAGQILKSPAAPEKKAAAQGAGTQKTDELILKAIPDRSQRAQAPEMLQPKRRWATQNELVEHFKKSRDGTIAFVTGTQDDLRSHFGPNPVFKELDAYQWILFLSAHTERHVAQLKEVKTHPGFPK
jgi:DinB superfamily